MFSDQACNNIGRKLRHINKNPFINDFLYQILEQTPDI